MSHWDAFMRTALKAQNQCRMTLETLATINNPPLVFANQEKTKWWAAAGRRRGTAASRDAGSRARGEIPNHANRTMGGNRCATAGQPSGERGRRN